MASHACKGHLCLVASWYCFALSCFNNPFNKQLKVLKVRHSAKFLGLFVYYVFLDSVALCRPGCC